MKIKLLKSIKKLNKKSNYLYCNYFRNKNYHLFKINNKQTKINKLNHNLLSKSRSSSINKESSSTSIASPIVQ